MPNRKSLSYKQLPVYGFKALDDQKGIIEAFVSVMGNVDMANERVKFGAFTESLSKKLPKVAWGHDWKQPIGKTLEAREVPSGDPSLPDEIKAFGALYVKGQLNLETQRGREAYSDLKFGAVDEFSIGYDVEQSQMQADGVTDLVKLKLFEWSPVLIGCNEETSLVSIKEMKTTPLAKRKPTAHSKVLALKSLDLSKYSHFKGQYLGDGIEASLAYGVFYDLLNSLGWALWTIMDNAIAEEPDKIMQVGQAFDEAKELALAFATALLMQEEAEDVTDVAEDASDNLTATETAAAIEKAISQIAVAHKDFFGNMSRKEGRTFSSKNVDTLLEKCEAMKTMAKGLKSHAKDIEDMVAGKATTETDTDSGAAGDKSIPALRLKSIADFEAELQKPLF